MNIDKDPIRETNNPEKAYRDELENKGSTFTDTPAESDARDAAKIHKVSKGETQKIDGGNPDADDEDSVSDEEIRRETLEKK